VSRAPLILTDGGLALSEPKAVGAQGSTKVLAASSLGSFLVFVSSAVVTVALAAIGRDMRLSPLDLQWVMNAELLPLAALKNDDGRMHRPEPGSWADRSINGFCIRKNMSRSTYVKRRRAGLGPREVQSLPGGKISIPPDSETEYDEKYSKQVVATA
jgi:hypothetical protein